MYKYLDTPKMGLCHPNCMESSCPKWVPRYAKWYQRAKRWLSNVVLHEQCFSKTHECLTRVCLFFRSIICNVNGLLIYPGLPCQADEFLVEAVDLGDLDRVRVGHDGSGSNAGWLLEKIVVQDPRDAAKVYEFPCGRYGPGKYTR